MHFNKQRLRSPRQLTALCTALDFDLWLPQGHVLLRRSGHAASAVPEPRIEVGKQRSERPAAERPGAAPAASVAARTVTKHEVTKPAVTRPEVTKPEVTKPASTPASTAAEAPAINLALTRMPGLLWVLEQQQWPDAQSLLQEVALFQRSTATLNAIPFVWPQPDIPVDQSEPRAVEALQIRIQNLQQADDRLVIVGEIPQRWLERCGPVSAGAIVFSTLAGLLGQAAEKRRLWRALIAADKR